MDTLEPIPGFLAYSVTRDGRVWSSKGQGRWLKPLPSKAGYPTFCLRRDGKGHHRHAHVLVALTFIGPRPEGHDIRHLNGDPLDNRVENLAYGTRSQNNRDAVAQGRHHEARKTHCSKGHPFDEANTYRNPHGFRACRKCNAEYQRLRQARLRAQ